MEELIRRATVKGTLEFPGIHPVTGRKSLLSVHPAEPGTGLVFVKNDVEIPARLENATEQRNLVLATTVLENDGEQVGIVEHVLAAMWLAGITDALIEPQHKICPTFERNIRDICFGLGENRRYLSEPAEFFTVDNTVEFHRPNGPDRIVMEPGPGLHISYLFGFPNTPQVTAEYHGDRQSRLKIMSSRPPYWSTKKLLGPLGGLVDAVALAWPHGINRTSYVVLTKNADGDLDAFSEVAYHKIVDLMGDMMLAGKPFYGVNITAEKTSHETDHAFLEELMQSGQLRRVYAQKDGVMVPVD